jgi:hypothetical protein
MRQASDKRMVSKRGRPVSEFPWFGDRAIDWMIHASAEEPRIREDMSLSPDYAHRHGLVTYADISRSTGVVLPTVKQWPETPYFPPRRAWMLPPPQDRTPSHAGGRRALFSRREVQLWIAWAKTNGRYPSLLAAGAGDTDD